MDRYGRPARLRRNVFDGSFDAGDSKISRLASPDAETDACTKKYVDQRCLQLLPGGDLGASLRRIQGVATPKRHFDAANKAYVDLTVAGGGFASLAREGSALSLGGRVLADAGPPVEAGDAVTLRYLQDAALVAKRGADNYDAGGRRISHLREPTQDRDSATKKYVDLQTSKAGALLPVREGTALSLQGRVLADAGPPLEDGDAVTLRHLRETADALQRNILSTWSERVGDNSGFVWRLYGLKNHPFPDVDGANRFFYFPGDEAHVEAPLNGTIRLVSLRPEALGGRPTTMRHGGATLPRLPYDEPLRVKQGDKIAFHNASGVSLDKRVLRAFFFYSIAPWEAPPYKEDGE